MHGGCPLRARRCRCAGERSEAERRRRREGRREGRRRHPPTRTLDAPVVVEEPPPVDQVPRLRQRVEDLGRQQLVTQPAVEVTGVR